MKKRILILVLSNIKHDARVRRQVAALKDTYQVTLVCFGGEESQGYELITIQPTPLTFLRKSVASFFLLTRLFPIAHRVLHDYGFIVKKLSAYQFDLIVANDVETLPIAFSFPYSPKVIFDAHEYAPRHFEDKASWRLFFQKFNTWLCRVYIPKTSGMMTVGKGLAREYEKHFQSKPVVVTNANVYSKLEPTPINDLLIRLVHHGIATPSRRLELMIDLISLLDDRYTLDLILLKPGFASQATSGYIDVLRQRAGGNKRIKILDPVPISKVVETVNQYDMGLFLLPPINFNYENTLPNKLFDFIQGRLGVAIGPTPEMAEIVSQYKIGVVSADFTPASLAERMNNLTLEEIKQFKINSEAAAKALNAENNAIIIQNLVKNVIG
ncbi:MAG: hypothetical protein ABIS36_20070 [Chryseolinea sp.]